MHVIKKISQKKLNKQEINKKEKITVAQTKKGISNIDSLLRSGEKLSGSFRNSGQYKKMQQLKTKFASMNESSNQIEFNSLVQEISKNAQEINEDLELIQQIKDLQQQANKSKKQKSTRILQLIEKDPGEVTEEEAGILFAFCNAQYAELSNSYNTGKEK